MDTVGQHGVGWVATARNVGVAAPRVGLGIVPHELPLVARKLTAKLSTT